MLPDESSPSVGRSLLHRSAISVPCGQLRFFEKAAKGQADVVILDLEDSVAYEDKDRARRNAIAAINEMDWGDKTLSVRINASDTPWMLQDLTEIVSQAGRRLDLIMLPKINTAADVYAADVIVSQIELSRQTQFNIGFEILIETASGLQHVDSIATASKRNRALHFGVADYAASTGARTVRVGGPNPHYFILGQAERQDGPRARHWGDMWHYALARIVVAARSAGLSPIDGPFGDISDAEGYRAEATRAAGLGCDGKWVIHPSQIPIANEVFSPTAEEVAGARGILAALDQSGKDAKGAVLFEGRMIGMASIRQAEVVVRRAETIARRASVSA
jgi:malyl-CoA/(S)-citramalyl-CoA lyase